MAENDGVDGNSRFVTFQSDTEEAVTFVWEYNGTLRVRFTLPPRGSHSLPRGTTLTYETLRMVVGTDSNGSWTNITITTDELVHLEKVIVTKPGNEFELVRQPRRTLSQRVSGGLSSFRRVRPPGWLWPGNNIDPALPH